MSLTGIHDISSLLESRFKSVLAREVGFEGVQDIIQRDLAVWNRQVTEILADLAMPVGMTRQEMTGSSTNIEGQEVDEYGAGETKESEIGAPVAYELRRIAFPVGHTTRFMRNATVYDLAKITQQTQVAHIRGIRKYLKRAIYTSANNTFNDLNVDNFALTIKRFINADGDPIPESPQDGSTFNPATHTHYLANASLDVANANALIDTVLEHSIEGDIRIVINRADIAGWEGLTGFIKAQPVLMQYNLNNDVPTTPRDRGRSHNRFIGQFNDADVWVKPWGIANYAFAYDRNAPQCLGYRTDGGLELVQDLMLNPLTVEFFEALYGFGVKTRYAGAVLYHAGGSYVDPTISN